MVEAPHKCEAPIFVCAGGLFIGIPRDAGAGDKIPEDRDAFAFGCLRPKALLESGGNGFVRAVS